MIGDIILFYNNKKSSLNTMAQRRFFDDDYPIVSHVALFTGLYTVIHSIARGVEETLFVELFDPNLDIRIVRYMPLFEFLSKDDANFGAFWFSAIEVTG